MTRSEMQLCIQQGRNAIEEVMLEVVMRSQGVSAQDETEMAELSILHQLYNRLMAKYERVAIVGKAANDDQSE